MERSLRGVEVRLDADDRETGGTVSEVQPRGEKLRRALRWVSERLQEQPERSRAALVDEAALRFDLAPKEAEFLLDFYRKAPPSN